MASFSTQTEGQSITRPPYFNGDNYSLWKIKMEVYIQGLDPDLWYIIENGPYEPFKGEGDKKTPKDKNEWDELDKKKVALNARAKSIFFCALGDVELNRIITLQSAKEIWNTLQVIHEGTSQVKQSKIDGFVRSYELFSMEPNESIKDMFTRFTSITNSLESLGKEYSNEEKVRKILRSLPRVWEPKVTAIGESKDLAKLDLQELLGSLLTHEINMRNYEKEPVAKTKGLALKSKVAESDDDSDQEDLTLITSLFKKFLKKKGSKFYKRDDIKVSKKDDSSEKTCFKCNKKGHFKSDCPLNKSNNYEERRVHKATLDDSSDEDTSDNESIEETANLCLMADIDDQMSDHSPEDIHDAFQELFDSHIALMKKHKHLKAEKQHLLTENEDLKNTLEKLNKSTCNLHDLLSVQKHATDRTGLGFKKNTMHATPLTSTKFVKATNYHVEEKDTMCVDESKIPTTHQISHSGANIKQNCTKMNAKKNPKDKTYLSHRVHNNSPYRLHKPNRDNAPRDKGDSSWRLHRTNTCGPHEKFRKRNYTERPRKFNAASRKNGLGYNYHKKKRPYDDAASHGRRRIIQVWIPKSYLPSCLIKSESKVLDFKRPPDSSSLII